MKAKKRITITADYESLIPILIGSWRRLHKIAGGPPDVLQTREFRGVVSAIKTLQEGLESGDKLRDQDYFTDKNLLGAYLLYQSLLHYSQGISLLNELLTPPKRVLDVCAGTAPFSLAALRHGAGDVWAIDRNLGALELGADICGRMGYPLSIRKWKSGEKLPVDGRFDLIIIGYSLEELFPDTKKDYQEQQTLFISNILEKLTPQGTLLLVESSWNSSNLRVLKLREQLIQKGVKILAPCINQNSCPMLNVANGTCYAQREFEKPYLIKELQRAASINLSSLKMSYLMLRGPETLPLNLKPNLYRVISSSVETFKGKSFFLCGNEGKKLLGTRLKEHPSESRAFEFLKRGDVVSIENALSQKDFFDIVDDTTVSVESPVGKPIIKNSNDL